MAKCLISTEEPLFTPISSDEPHGAAPLGNGNSTVFVLGNHAKLGQLMDQHLLRPVQGS